MTRTFHWVPIEPSPDQSLECDLSSNYTKLRDYLTHVHQRINNSPVKSADRSLAINNPLTNDPITTANSPFTRTIHDERKNKTLILNLKVQRRYNPRVSSLRPKESGLGPAGGRRVFPKILRCVRLVNPSVGRGAAVCFGVEALRSAVSNRSSRAGIELL